MKEFGRFVRIALNSCSEVEHHLIVARDLKVIPAPTFESLVAQTITVRKMLYGLDRMLANAKPKGRRDRDSQPTTRNSNPEQVVLL